jgi:hypothetical protein
MNKLTEEEFQDRVEAVVRARKIFIKLTEGNISNAFILYQEVLAEKYRPILLDSKNAGSRVMTQFDSFIRPKCPDCNSDMSFRQIKDNEEGIRSQLVCSNKDCDTVLNSELSLDDWMRDLEKKDGPEQTKTIE